MTRFSGTCILRNRDTQCAGASGEIRWNTHDSGVVNLWEKILEENQRGRNLNEPSTHALLPWKIRRCRCSLEPGFCKKQNTKVHPPEIRSVAAVLSFLGEILVLRITSWKRALCFKSVWTFAKPIGEMSEILNAHTSTQRFLKRENRSKIWPVSGAVSLPTYPCCKLKTDGNCTSCAWIIKMISDRSSVVGETEQVKWRCKHCADMYLYNNTRTENISRSAGSTMACFCQGASFTGQIWNIWKHAFKGLFSVEQGNCSEDVWRRLVTRTSPVTYAAAKSLISRQVFHSQSWTNVCLIQHLPWENSSKGIGPTSVFRLVSVSTHRRNFQNTYYFTLGFLVSGYVFQFLWRFFRVMQSHVGGPIPFCRAVKPPSRYFLADVACTQKRSGTSTHTGKAKDFSVSINTFALQAVKVATEKHDLLVLSRPFCKTSQCNVGQFCCRLLRISHNYRRRSHVHSVSVSPTALKWQAKRYVLHRSQCWRRNRKLKRQYLHGNARTHENNVVLNYSMCVGTCACKSNRSLNEIHSSNPRCLDESSENSS